MTLVFEYNDGSTKTIEITNIVLGHLGFSYTKDGESVFVDFTEYKYCSVRE